MSGRKGQPEPPPPSSSVFFRTLFADDGTDDSSDVAGSVSAPRPVRQVAQAREEEEDGVTFQKGDHVEALCFADSEYYLAKVLGVSQDDDDCFDIYFLETGETQHATPFDCLRAVQAEDEEGEAPQDEDEAGDADYDEPQPPQQQPQRSKNDAEDFNFQKESIFLHLPVREIRVGGKLFRNVFDGKHAVTFLLENGDDFFCNVRTRRDAVRLFQRMMDEQSIVAVEGASKTFTDSFALYMINSGMSGGRLSKGPLLSRDTFAEVRSFLNEEFERESSELLPRADADDDFAGFSMSEASVRGAKEAPIAAASDNEFWESMGRDVRSRRQTLLEVKSNKTLSNQDLDDEVAKILGTRPAAPATSSRAAAGQPPPHNAAQQSTRAANAVPRTGPPRVKQQAPRGAVPASASASAVARTPVRLGVAAAPASSSALAPQFAPRAPAPAKAASRGPVAAPASAVVTSKPPKRPDSVAMARQPVPAPPSQQPAFLGIGVVGQAFQATRSEQVSVAVGQEVLVVARPAKTWLIVSYGDMCGSIPVTCLRHFTPYSKQQRPPQQQQRPQQHQQPQQRQPQQLRRR